MCGFRVERASRVLLPAGDGWGGGFRPWRERLESDVERVSHGLGLLVAQRPAVFISGVVVTVWGISVLAMMRNDKDRWTGHPMTKGKIRNQSWFQVVAGVVLVVIAVTT